MIGAPETFVLQYLYIVLNVIGTEWRRPPLKVKLPLSKKRTLTKNKPNLFRLKKYKFKVTQDEFQRCEKTLTRKKGILCGQLKSRLKILQDEFHSSLKLFHLGDTLYVRKKFDSVMSHIFEDVLACVDLVLDNLNRIEEHNESQSQCQKRDILALENEDTPWEGKSLNYVCGGSVTSFPYCSISVTAVLR